MHSYASRWRRSDIVSLSAADAALCSIWMIDAHKETSDLREATRATKATRL